MAKQVFTKEQKTLMAVGEKMAKDMGLTRFSFHKVNKHEVSFEAGQIGLVVGPDTISLGAFEVQFLDHHSLKRWQYNLANAFQLVKSEYLREGEWKAYPSDLYLPAYHKLYIAEAAKVVSETKESAPALDSLVQEETAAK